MVDGLNLDVLVLNEYVDSENTKAFKLGLERIGFTNISISDKLGRHNQILIASKVQHSPGDLVPPQMDNDSKSNFLHVLMADDDLEIVGLRVPFYKGAGLLKKYWEQLRDIIAYCKDRKILFIGDFNGSPDKPRTVTGRQLTELISDGWRLPSPEGAWSYISHDGKARSSIDHALLSPSLGNASAAYHKEVGGILLAGVKAHAPISDHAILAVDFDL